ncbi:MAG TPA: Mu-like prophage major head subunit gpT family protein [Anaerolineae bacterium]|nr:Mu-like prophage major head subunit gpT family protein [Anaerolineae bacterium]
MVINQANMDGLFRTYSTALAEAQQAARQRAFPNQLIVGDLALEMTVGGAAVQHAWLSQIRGMRKWVGDRVINNLETGTMTVVNDSFENTVGVPRTSIEDDQYGVFTPLIAALGADAEQLWLRLAVAALVGNGAWADGNPFFCSGRKFGSGGTITNAVKTAFSKAAVETAIKDMRGWRLAGDEPADVAPDLLLVGPDLEGTALSIVEADIEVNAAGTHAVSNVSTARMLKVRVDVRIPEGRWYVTARKAGIACTAVQKRKTPKLTRMDRDTDQNVFMSDQFLYGVDARGAAFCTLPFLAYAGGFAEVPKWDKALVK